MRYTSPLIKEVLKSKAGQKALDRITPIYMDSRIGLCMLESIGIELDELRKLTDDIRTQIVPQTATWTIDYWEQEYGIPVNRELSLEQTRRPRLLAKIRSRAPMNPAKLIKLIKLEVNNLELPVDIVENVAKNTFLIKVIPNSFHTNWKRVYRLVDRVKPAHIIYFIVMYDFSKFYVPIEIELNLNLISDIYVRSGSKSLSLNNNWFLDNTYTLNGYESDIVIDYYPVTLKLISDYNIPLLENLKIKYISNFKIDNNTNSYLKFISQFSIRAEQFLLNGDFWLNGDLNLNGFVSDYGYNYYPLEIKLTSDIDNNVLAKSICLVKTCSKNNLNVDIHINIISDFIARQVIGKYPSNGYFDLGGYKYDVYPLNCKIISQVKNIEDVKYKSSLRVEDDLWYLDGTSNLDGVHKLKANIYTYSI